MQQHEAVACEVSVCQRESRRVFLRESDVLELIPISRTTLWRWVRQGTFPRPVKLSNAVTVWKAGKVQAWIDMPGAWGHEEG